MNIAEAFEREKRKLIETRTKVAEVKKMNFATALDNVRATLQQLEDEGIPTELESPVADWLEEFYEHGCVWLNTDLRRLANLWPR